MNEDLFDIAGIGEESESLREALLKLRDKYGEEWINRTATNYFDTLGRLADLNTSLSELSEDSDAYSETVSRIMSVTQEYYSFIGKLPDDMRRLFLNVLNGSTIDIDTFNAVLNTEIRLETAALLAVQSIRPKQYIMQIDAITNQLANLSDTTTLRVGARGSRPVKTTVTLDMPDHMKIEGGVKLSTYDKSIINGITSLLESGNTVFSIPMLYHAMTGKKNPSVDEALSEEVGGKLEKMRRMILSIDLTEDIAQRQFRDKNGELIDVSDMKLEGYLLPLNKVTGTVNGKKTELYQILQNPPLYTYSKLKRQLASVSIEMLDAPINNNSTTIPLKTYLLQRVEMMKNPRNNIRSNRILYESVYTELGAQDAGKTRKMRIREYTTTILEYFVDMNYIKKFSPFKDGRSIGGVEITL